MNKKWLFLIFVVIDIFLVFFLILNGSNIELLNPKGVISLGERNVLLTLTSIMLLAAIPVLTLLFYTAWKYREGNTKVKYDPDNRASKIQLIWWIIPAAFVVVLGFISWNATHVLDPYKPISSNVKPITIQVIALEWKWLFIYPEQNIATVNYIQFPVNTPVNFELTADAPMNSFWIPQLSGQIYAMTGMSTKLHILATEIGDYNGSAAEINGKGFSEMRFIARASSGKDFNSWVNSVKKLNKPLDVSQYKKIAKPSENSPKQFYSPVDQNLYNSVIDKFMMPASNQSELEDSEHVMEDMH